jgi:probable F420-dependent oxidoreductase
MLPSAEAVAAVAELEDLGFGAVWVPEAVGREPFANCALLLDGSSRIVLATGIANIHFRSAMAMSAGHRTLTEAHPNRFLLGMGVSHAPMVEGLLHQSYERPLSTMRAYLDAMDSSFYAGAAPPHEPQRVLAALGPKMNALAAERAAGVHPYFVPVDHTAFAREALGADPLVCVEQAVAFETDAQSARDLARTHTAIYTTLPNYTNNLRRYGFGDEDFENAGSDRLIDAIVAWGDLDAIVARVRSHFDAGADHVCLQVLTRDQGANVEAWRRLAEALPDLAG